MGVSMGVVSVWVWVSGWVGVGVRVPSSAAAVAWCFRLAARGGLLRLGGLLMVLDGVCVCVCKVFHFAQELVDDG